MRDLTTEKVTQIRLSLTRKFVRLKRGKWMHRNTDNAGTAENAGNAETVLVGFLSVFKGKKDG
jgi:hypothetical protein